jgi:hypothetical protein
MSTPTTSLQPAAPLTPALYRARNDLATGPDYPAWMNNLATSSGLLPLASPQQTWLDLLQLQQALLQQMQQQWLYGWAGWLQAFGQRGPAEYFELEMRYLELGYGIRPDELLRRFRPEPAPKRIKVVNPEPPQAS